jgi:hypothetical protein
VAVASGDNNKSNLNLQTFNPLFVRGNYLTEAGLLSSQNFFDVFPSIRIKPGPKWTAELGFDIHCRENLGDGIYEVAGSGGSPRSVRSCIPSFPHQSATSYQHKMWYTQK